MTDHSLTTTATPGRRDVSIVNAISGRSSVAVVAARAGRLAPLTGELARAIAGRSHRLYCRATDAAPECGRAAREPMQLDEPILRTVLAGSRTIVAITDSRCDEDAMTVLRGSNRDLVLRLWNALTEVGFAAMIATPCPSDADPANLFNRSSGGGVELVLTQRLRRDLERGFLRRPLFESYVGAVQRALTAELSQLTPTLSSAA